MTTADFCKHIKDASDDISSDTKAKKLVHLVFDTAALLLAQGEPVLIDGFGKFIPVNTNERAGHNPATGEPIQIPASRKVMFKPAKGLKDLVKAGK
jgi:DNA-binding protein HU-beta